MRILYLVPIDRWFLHWVKVELLGALLNEELLILLSVEYFLVYRLCNGPCNFLLLCRVLFLFDGILHFLIDSLILYHLCALYLCLCWLPSAVLELSGI